MQVYKAPDWSGRTVWGNEHRDKALAGMRYFDELLCKDPFIAGATFSMPDITVFAGLIFADAAGIAIPEDLTALLAWRAKVAELPSVKNRSGQNFLAEDLKRLGF